jgi:hypothetical protein
MRAFLLRHDKEPSAAMVQHGDDKTVARLPARFRVRKIARRYPQSARMESTVARKSVSAV